MTTHEERSGGEQAMDLERETRRVFDAGVERVDAATRARLAAARAAAVAATGSSGTARPTFGSYGLAGLGVAAALVVAVLVLQPPARDAGVELSAFDDLDILLDEEELELYEELEFYVWLEEQPELRGMLEDADGSG